MTTLHLGKIQRSNSNFTLPLAAVTSTIAILARKGRGKSYTAAVLAEELLKAGQVPIIIDPTSAHWGLKSSADGKSAGFPVVVFGGDHADVPLEEHAGEIVARAIVEQRFPAIIDLSLFRKGATCRFLTAFFETLYRINREAVHILADEADYYAPQSPHADQARVLGAMEDIVRRGRIKGIGCTMISQRPAVINKNILTQADMLVALGMNHPRDINAIQEWIAVHGDEKKAALMIASLPALAVGTAWFWAPALNDTFEIVEVRERETFDSSATPKAGEKAVAPKKLAEIDVAKLGEAIAATVVRAKENDPAELKRRIADLQKQLGAAQKAACVATTIKEVSVIDAETLRRIDAADNHVIALNKAVHELHQEVIAVARETNEILINARAFKPRNHDTLTSFSYPRVGPTPEELGKMAKREPRTPGANGSLGGGMRRMMIAIAQRPGIDHRQLGLRARLSSRSGTFSTYLAKLRGNGWLDDQNGFTLTEAGLKSLGRYIPLPTGNELAQHWMHEVGGGAARMLEALIAAYPSPLSHEELGDKANLSPASGTFSTYLSRLRGLELVEGRGELRASAELFSA